LGPFRTSNTHTHSCYHPLDKVHHFKELIHQTRTQWTRTKPHDVELRPSWALDVPRRETWSALPHPALQSTFSFTTGRQEMTSRDYLSSPPRFETLSCRYLHNRQTCKCSAAEIRRVSPNFEKTLPYHLRISIQNASQKILDLSLSLLIFS